MSQETIRKLAERLYEQINEHSEKIAGESYCTYTGPTKEQREASLAIYEAELAPFGALLEAAEGLMKFDNSHFVSRNSVNAVKALRAALSDIQKG